MLLVKKHVAEMSSIIVIIILIQSGLGNQMFCYSFFLSLKSKYPNALILFKIAPSVNQHNGLELFRIFNIKDRWRYRFCKVGFFWKHFKIIKQSNALVYDANIKTIKNNFNYFEGHWQSEKYFENNEEQIRQSFVFNKKLLNDFTLKYSKEILETNSVSIHIRRGDYLNFPQCEVCNVNYYNRAVDYINNLVQNAVFYIFSDDIEWCKQNLSIANSNFMCFNKSKNSWQDMYLMSICKHNIIANSTFSWWGAWLNTNPNKIVISPKQWFKDSPTEDIIPDNWIKL